jgi:hypothetical protein
MNENKAKLDVKEQSEELSPKERKLEERRAAKEEKRLKDYYGSMIPRGEAIQMMNQIAKQTADGLGDMLREPIRTNIISNMALSDLLKDKGIITEEEHLEAMNKIATQLNETLKSDDNEGEGNEQGTTEEEEEQQS